jgi:hypothetical protein
MRQLGRYPVNNGFAVFPDDQTGLVEMGKQLQRYAARGIDTINGIISTYAPAGDGNNVPAYVGDVSKRTGFNPSMRLDLNDPNVLRALESAMVFHEQGNNAYQALIPSAISHVANGGDVSQVYNTTINATNTDGKQLAKDFTSTVKDMQNDNYVRYGLNKIN